MLKIWPFHKKVASPDLSAQNSGTGIVAESSASPNRTSQLAQNIWQLCEEYFLKVEGEKRQFAVYEWLGQTWSFELKVVGNQQVLHVKTIQAADLGLDKVITGYQSSVLYHITLSKEADCLECDVSVWPVDDQILAANLEPTEAKLITLYQLLNQLKQHNNSYSLRNQLFAP